MLILAWCPAPVLFGERVPIRRPIRHAHICPAFFGECVPVRRPIRLAHFCLALGARTDFFGECPIVTHHPTQETGTTGQAEANLHWSGLSILVPEYICLHVCGSWGGGGPEGMFPQENFLNFECCGMASEAILVPKTLLLIFALVLAW